MSSLAIITRQFLTSDSDAGSKEGGGATVFSSEDYEGAPVKRLFAPGDELRGSRARTASDSLVCPMWAKESVHVEAALRRGRSIRHSGYVHADAVEGTAGGNEQRLPVRSAERDVRRAVHGNPTELVA